eukprot:TRINITY_DN61839_c0_g1_i1.p1 TRINITY_DN61839_c0_g1~~TRINITY_DN61839_c0_g1_i1.p1  ORF type:complete len:492 (+),score=85.19 TRINITY_DN61839_c0_g1_i1:55-1476(+)
MASRPCPREAHSRSRGTPFASALPRLSVAVAAALGGGWSARGQSLDEIPPDRLAMILAQQLQGEDARKPERVMKFDAFQDITELDCPSRMIWLVNRAATLRDKLGGLHENIAGLYGLSATFLKNFPQENSWIWLLTKGREGAMQQVHAHFAEVTAMSLDKQDCLSNEARNILLEGVLQWKAFHVESTSLTWNSMAFASSGEAGAKAAWESGLPATNWGGAMAAGEAWLAKIRQWLEEYVGRLYFVAQRNVPQVNGATQDGGVRMHHQDDQGMFVPYEYLRRKSFGQWALDRGLLRGLLRYVWQPPLPPAGSEEGSFSPVSVADFGAGGGQYSTWLNETGLVQAFAFDGTKNAAEVTGGAVQEINLIEETHLWRKFDWVISLEVGEHIPKQFAVTFLHNVRRHLTRGLVMSWSDDWEGIGHVNCLSREDFLALVERETGLRHDQVLTDVVKEKCEIDYIARTLAVFRAVDEDAS